MERTAATGDWGLLLQSVWTHVSSSHVDLLEQKKVFTYEKSWTPTGLTNMAEKSGNFKNGCRLTYDVFTGCLTLKLDVKNTSRPHPHPLHNLDSRLSLQAKRRESGIKDALPPKMLSGILCMQTTANNLENIRNVYWINDSCILNEVKYYFATS